MSFIAEDLVSLSIVESSSFRELLYSLEPRYSVPSRKHLSSVLIKESYEKLFDQMKECQTTKYHNGYLVKSADEIL